MINNSCLFGRSPDRIVWITMTRLSVARGFKLFLQQNQSTSNIEVARALNKDNKFNIIMETINELHRIIEGISGLFIGDQ
jgi:hypothetical protein